MPSFPIQVNDKAVKTAIAKLQLRANALEPALRDIGEALKINIDRYFATQTGPDGRAWQGNKLATIEAYIQGRGGFSKTTGKLNKRGLALTGTKKVLQGISGELRRSIYWQLEGKNTLVIGSPKPYAAIHNYGGPFKAWGRTDLIMPARPFMPMDKDKKLFPEAKLIIMKRLRVHLNSR